jgi:hypothetical protein
VAQFHSEAEKAAVNLAEALDEKAFAAMHEAEGAAARYRIGKQRMRLQFQQRGLGRADADIRWSGTTDAKKALSDNSWYMQQAIMYHSAAAAQYARALYLRSSDA